MAACQSKLAVCIRWLIRRDMPEVLGIENLAFEFPWDEEEFLNCLRQRSCVGMVAERDDKIVGHMIYELQKNQIHVLNFAILPSMQRRGIGSQMVQKLISKLTQQRRKSIVLEVRETNLDAQLFFSKMGFLATDVVPGSHEETAEDNYVFKWQLPNTSGIIDRTA